MPTTVTTRGQVTIPIRVRERLGIKAGDEIQFDLNSNGEVVFTKVNGGPPKSRLDSIIGIAGPGPTTDELMMMLRGPDDGL